jgi:hypothetical protein
VDRLQYARSHPTWSRRKQLIHTAARIVSRTRVAERLVKAMNRGELSLKELRSLVHEPSVPPSSARIGRRNIKDGGVRAPHTEDARPELVSPEGQRP